MGLDSISYGFSRAALPLALLGACSIAPEDCLDISAPHEFWGDVPKDIGGGFVALNTGHSFRHDGFGGSTSGIDLIDCVNRDVTSFQLGGTTIENGIETSDNSASEDENSQSFREFFDSDTVVTKEEIVAKARSLGIEPTNTKLSREHCGCAAFYPALVGDQEPAEERGA